MNLKFYLFLFVLSNALSLLGQTSPLSTVEDFTALLNHYTKVKPLQNEEQAKQLRASLSLNEEIPYYDFSASPQEIIPLKRLFTRVKASEGVEFKYKAVRTYLDSKGLDKAVVIMIEKDTAENFIAKDTLVFAIREQRIAAIYLFQDADRDDLDNESDACPDEKGEMLLFGCPDDDEDGIPNGSDNCPQTPKEVHVTPEGCWDEDKDGIPNYRDICTTVVGTTAICGCPDERSSLKLQKLNALTSLHPIEPITVLQWVAERSASGSKNGRLVSGSKNGRLSVSCVNRKKYKPHKAIRIVGEEPSIILPLEDNNLLISSKNELVLVELREKTFSNPKTIDNRKYLDLKQLNNKIFLKEQSGWLQKQLEATTATLLQNTRLIGINRDAKIATYDKGGALSIYEQEVTPEALQNSFNIDLDKPIYLTAYQDTSWLLINKQGQIEMANQICLGAIPTISNDKRIISIKQSQDHQLIALLFDDKTWEIWQKHSVATVWKKINTQKLVKERTTAIELSPDGKYFFEGTNEGLLQAYLIVKK